MSAAHLPASPCTNCGNSNDAATMIGGAADAMPVPGDLSLCFYCGHLMAYDSELQLRELSDAEIVAVAGDRKLVAASKALGAVWKAAASRRRIG